MPTAGQLIPPRPTARAGTVVVNNETALRHSAVWACLRLRADLISTMPVDVYRRVGGVQVEMPKPPIMVMPGGDDVDWCEWMYSSQFDLDRAGNVFGLITEVNALGLPSRIELQPLAECSVLVRSGELFYRIGGKVYAREKVWHERQFTIAGFPLGLSPVAYAAWSIGEYLSIQEFALGWFGDGTIPAAMLRNTAKTINASEATVVKDRFKAAVAGRDLFVTGNDWEYKMIQAEQASSDWIEAKKFGVTDIARFFGAPADLIEGAVSGSSVTYANITQKDLDFLVHHLGPAITRRERKFSTKLLPQPRYMKFNTDALLRMDPETRARVIASRIASRTLTPDEGRELENMAPLTEDQYAQFDRLFGSAKSAASTMSASARSIPSVDRRPIRAEAVAGEPIAEITSR